MSPAFHREDPDLIPGQSHFTFVVDKVAMAEIFFAVILFQSAVSCNECSQLVLIFTLPLTGKVGTACTCEQSNAIPDITSTGNKTTIRGTFIFFKSWIFSFSRCHNIQNLQCDKFFSLKVAQYYILCNATSLTERT